jgi:hypothetical protein
LSEHLIFILDGESRKAGETTCQPDAFLPRMYYCKKGLDLLYVILRKGTYDVTRFQYRPKESRPDVEEVNEDSLKLISE